MSRHQRHVLTAETSESSGDWYLDNALTGFIKKCRFRSGGVYEVEAHLAQELGIASVSLGTRILRAETAAIAAAAIIQYENGDLGGR